MRFASWKRQPGATVCWSSPVARAPLLDCGFSLREATYRLQRLGVGQETLAGVLVTHEHSDHLAGVVRLAARFNLPVWLTTGTATMLSESESAYGQLRRIDSQQSLAVGDLEILPFTVPHDAQEPVPYVFGDGNRRLGVLTDCGSLTSHVQNYCRPAMACSSNATTIRICWLHPSTRPSSSAVSAAAMAIWPTTWRRNC